jgi:hypothetical protein
MWSNEMAASERSGSNSKNEKSAGDDSDFSDLSDEDLLSALPDNLTLISNKENTILSATAAAAATGKGTNSK